MSSRKNSKVTVTPAPIPEPSVYAHAGTALNAFLSQPAAVPAEDWAFESGEAGDGFEAHLITARVGSYAVPACDPKHPFLADGETLPASFACCAFCNDGVLRPADSRTAAPVKNRAAKSPRAPRELTADEIQAQWQYDATSARLAELKPAYDAVVTKLAELKRRLPKSSGATGTRTESADVPAEHSKSILILGICAGAGETPTAVKSGAKTGKQYGTCPVCENVRGLSAKGVMRNHPPVKGKTSDQATADETVTDTSAAA